MTRQERKVSSPRVVNISDLRRLAQQRLPRVLFDYLDGGADAEVTLRENVRAFEEVTFRPRQALYIPERDTRTSLLGSDLSMPMLLAPCGFSHMFYPHAEPTAARAAGKAGIGYVLTTMSGHRLEDVAEATTGPRWYQLYLAGGHEAGKGAIERAQKAGFSVLVITIDTGTFGMRERDVRNGAGSLLGANLFAKIPFLPQVLAHPGWLAGFLGAGGVRRLHNIVVPGKGTLPLSEAQSSLAKSVVTWDDLKWIRKEWPGPIVVKGAMIAEDAKHAVEEGAAGVIVSNHGGRQLDGVAPALRALPEIVAAVGGRTEVLVDGGIRRGSDIAKAICLGARAVLIGRAYMYGLGAAGEAGVARAIAILRADLERTMALLGCKSIAEMNRSYVDVPASWSVQPQI
jgi:L-lactate dehydrogenase (cytochrome)